MKKILFIFLLSMTVMLSGCGSNDTNINIGGSTSVQSLFNDMIEDYQSEESNISVTYDGQGSAASIQGVKNGSYILGTTSRKIKPSERTKNMVVKTLAYDEIVVITNKDNKLEKFNLSLKQLKDIYTGKITNWRQLGGDDQKILVISRDSASGTRDAFETIVNFNNTLNTESPDGTLEFASNAEVLSNVEANEGAIGYVSLDSVTDQVKTFSIDNVAPTLENLKLRKYKIARPYNLIYLQDKVTKENKEFINWIESHIKYYLTSHSLQK